MYMPILINTVNFSHHHHMIKYQILWHNYDQVSNTIDDVGAKGGHSSDSSTQEYANTTHKVKKKRKRREK